MSPSPEQVFIKNQTKLVSKLLENEIITTDEIVNFVNYYYDEDGNVDNITDISALRFVGDDVEELISVFELALNELKKNKDNVLEESNDKCNRDADEDCGC